MLMYIIPEQSAVASLRLEPRIEPKSWLEVEEVGRVSSFCCIVEGQTNFLIDA